jgi:hypothetical protein
MDQFAFLARLLSTIWTATGPAAFFTVLTYGGTPKACRPAPLGAHNHQPHITTYIVNANTTSARHVHNTTGGVALSNHLTFVPHWPR